MIVVLIVLGASDVTGLVASFVVNEVRTVDDMHEVEKCVMLFTGGVTLMGLVRAKRTITMHTIT